MTAGGTRGPSDIYRLVSMIMKKGFDPVIVFAFSKKECDSLSKQMADMDLVLEGEREMVDQIFESAVTCLEPQDRALPQVAAMLPMLRRGIGVHGSLKASRRPYPALISRRRPAAAPRLRG